MVSHEKVPPLRRGSGLPQFLSFLPEIMSSNRKTHGKGEPLRRNILWQKMSRQVLCH